MAEPTNTVLVVIPARGGSIGIPNKNLRKIHGKSLVSWAVVFANKLPNVDSICVSSDSEAILNESRDNGDCILDRRPDLLSGPAISGSSVLNHVLHFVEKEMDKYFDIVVMLQPTSPLRSFSEVMECIRLVAEGASAAWTVSKLDVKYHYKKQLLASEEGILRVAVPGPQVIARQELGDTYIRNGACYAISRKTLIEDPLLMGSNCGYVVSESARPNIDEEWDLQLAEQISFVNQEYLDLMSKINT
jgi:CMP-N-acetylneuraminic acid synthetase